MAAAVFRSTTGTSNLQRIARLLIVGGTALLSLREIFDMRNPPSYLPKMLQNPATVKRIQGVHLTKPQWDCLHPTPGVYSKSAHFDISLLLKLLKTTCNIIPPATGWDARPTNTDHSSAADLKSINVNQSMMKITDDQFLSLCEEMSDFLLKIAAQISPEKRIDLHKVIHKLLNNPLIVEEGRNVREILRWYENDTEAMKELMSEITTSNQVLSSETVFQENAQGIKELLREELKSKTQGFQEVDLLSSDGVEKGLKESTHVPEAPVREGCQITNEPGVVHQSAKNLNYSAGGSQVAGARLGLYINCEIISEPSVREGSPGKDVALHEPLGEVQGPTVGQLTSCQQQSSVPTAVIKDVHVMDDLFRGEQNAVSDCVQKREERLSLKGVQDGLEGTTHIAESAERDAAQDINDQLKEELKPTVKGVQKQVKRLSSKGDQGGLKGTAHATVRQESKGIKNQLQNKFQEVDRLSLASAGGPVAAASPLPLGIACETISNFRLLGEISQQSLREVNHVTERPVVPTEQKVLNVIAQKYFQMNDPSKPGELNGFLEYLKKVRKLEIVDTEIGSLKITLECGTLEILEGLWEDYNTGHMNEVAQKCLVTEDIIEEFGMVKLTTAILEEEYKACRQHFLQGSVKTSPETESMDQIESGSQAKSGSKMTIEASHVRLETVSESFSENKVEAPSYAESEKCEVSEGGGVWKLQEIQAAACITFPPNAVTKPVLFRCTLWESTTHFPPLKRNEALVSSVIVLTCDDPLSSNFTGEFDKEVTVALSHSACNLKGYEVVIRELVDSDNNHWRDLETTSIWQASGDIQYDPSAKPRIPFAEAKVTRCSAFAVLCRLKAYTFSTNALRKCDFTCVVEEYPDVSVTIPASVVHENRDFLLNVKVQEIPQQWFDDSEIIVGPVLHITCSPAIQLGKPATITMPISLQADTIDFAEFSSENVRVLVNSDEETSDWKEITDQLPRQANLTNGVVTFQATHFTRFSTWLEKMPFSNLESRASRLTKRIPLEAGFFACLCSSGCRGNSQLRFCCYPNHIESQVRKSICSTYEVFRYGNGDSYEPLCQGDVIFVTLREGLELSEDTSEDELQLRFRSDKKFESDVVVRDPCGHVPQIEFFKHLDEKPPRNKKLCKLSIIPTPTQTSNDQRCSVKTGNPSDDELEELSTKLGDKWEKLGRRLGFNQPKLTAFHKENERLFDKAHQMLMSWKEREGSDATYQVLYDALIHNLVACRLLAEEHCCN